MLRLVDEQLERLVRFEILDGKKGLELFKCSTLGEFPGLSLGAGIREESRECCNRVNDAKNVSNSSSSFQILPSSASGKLDLSLRILNKSQSFAIDVNTLENRARDSINGLGIFGIPLTIVS